jgi:hypothetical protein
MQNPKNAELRAGVFSLLAQITFDGLMEMIEEQKPACAPGMFAAQALNSLAGDEWLGENRELAILSGYSNEQLAPHCKEWLDRVAGSRAKPA